MKKNSIMVKQVLMSIITAGIFTFGFTSCSDDDPMSQDGAAANQEITSDGEGISKPIGLVYTDFITENDVQILNADTTEIAVSKALADKKGITNFVNHPMGIWQAFDQRAYLRRATAQRLVVKSPAHFRNTMKERLEWCKQSYENVEEEKSWTAGVEPQLFAFNYIHESADDWKEIHFRMSLNLLVLDSTTARKYSNLFGISLAYS